MEIIEKEYNTTDVVSLKGCVGLFHVTGVIHDDCILFVTDEEGNEEKVKFSDVDNHWVLSS